MSLTSYYILNFILLQSVNLEAKLHYTLSEIIISIVVIHTISSYIFFILMSIWIFIYYLIL